MVYVGSSKEMDCSKPIGLTACIPLPTFIDLLVFVYFCNSDMVKGRLIISLSIYEFFVLIKKHPWYNFCIFIHFNTSSEVELSLLPRQQVEVICCCVEVFLLTVQMEAWCFVMY